MVKNYALGTPLSVKHVSRLSLFTYRNYAQVWRPDRPGKCFGGVKNNFLHSFNIVSSGLVFIWIINHITTRVSDLYSILWCLPVQNKGHVGCS